MTSQLSLARISLAFSITSPSIRSQGRRVALVFAMIVAAATLASAQTLDYLYYFGADGANNPRWSGILAQGRDGNIYGTTGDGYSGTGSGNAYRMTPDGAFTNLFSFTTASGTLPTAGLTLGTDGNFYGSADLGGASNYGTVFSMTPAGKVTVLHSFTNGDDGSLPLAPPVQGIDGAFYGTASSCPTASNPLGCSGPIGNGSVYRITSSGDFTILHTFTGIDGYSPMDPLVQATDGDFYGTTTDGGANANGTIFKITPGGKFQVLYNLTNTSGTHPFAGLIQASDGNLYGVTLEGGTGGGGTAFRITLDGVLTVLHNFTGGTDGGNQVGGLVQATDGYLYGTNNLGAGVLFRIGLDGDDFEAFTSLDNAQASMMQHTNGILYGTTALGGSGPGTFFSFNLGLAPFVSALPAVAHIGQTIGILGQGFTGATGVWFNGLAASFKVESDTYITATIPANATTGNITVTESAGTLTSNKAFRVLPQITSFAPTSGAVGTTVVLTGTGFLGASRIVFARAKQAVFTVNSDTQITATVPAGAQTGPINVLTPGGPYGTEASFTVSP